MVLKDNRIAVYGSLMQGFWNYDKYLKHHVVSIEYGTVMGMLYHLLDTNCPALVAGDDIVSVQIMILSVSLGSIIKDLDALEGYFSNDNPNNIYNRSCIEVYNKSRNTVEILDIYYFNMKNSNVKSDNMIYIPSGDWRQYMSQ